MSSATDMLHVTAEDGAALMRREQSRYDDPDIVKTLKSTVAKGATDHEFQMFIEICKATGLNPFLREIWCAVPMKDGQRSQYGQVLIMAGRDGYLRVANDHPMFDGIETRVERDPNGIPIKAVCTVWRKDRNHPTISEAYFNEYYKPGYNGKPSVWDTYKSAMIAKVSEVLALKRSFSINGVVTEEEIGAQEPEPPTRAQAAETAKALGEVKVKALVAGATRHEAEAIQDAEFSDPPPSPIEETLVASIKQVKTSKNFTMLENFNRIKKELGDDEYYRILGAHGFEKSNQITDVEIGRAIYRDMKESLSQRIEADDRKAREASQESI